MKYVKYIAIIFVLAALLLIGFMIERSTSPVQPQSQAATAEHIYASWDIMEFDKCVAAWLITRFIDKDATFVLYPQGTEINQGILFDVPGADWSRKHRKCTSQCILESIDRPEPAIEKIVSMAGQTELNFWQLDRWPETQKCFYEVQEIIDEIEDPVECFEKTRPYFDGLYERFRKNSVTDNSSQDLNLEEGK